jgi:hypothetical protein
MGGAFVSKSAQSLVRLAELIEADLAQHKKRRMYLDMKLSILTREQLEENIQEAEQKPEKDRPFFLPDMKKMLDGRDEWFAFYHVHA